LASSACTTAPSKRSTWVACVEAPDSDSLSAFSLEDRRDKIPIAWVNRSTLRTSVSVSCRRIHMGTSTTAHSTTITA
jgi:hypothetical protein